MTHHIEPLGDHLVSDFTCGNVELDEWLHLHAHTARGHGTRTYLLIDPNDAVTGYFAIAPHLLSRGDAPMRIARGSSMHIPAVLLAKLALHTSAQGRGLGSELLVGAIEVIVNAARLGGGRVILVDAIDDAARSFYEHHDFEPLPGHSHRLVMKLSSAAHTLGVPWP